MTGSALLRFAALGAASIAVLAGPASAQTATVVGERPDDMVPTERVSFRDLNLASASGERTLVNRVRGAVRRVCADDHSPHPYINCRSFAWRDAKPQIDLAVKRARALAANGYSDIPPVAILIVGRP